MITNHTNRYKTASRVGYLGSSIPSGKPCQNRILFMNLLMDIGTHKAGSQARLGGEGRGRFIVTISGCIKYK